MTMTDWHSDTPALRALIARFDAGGAEVEIAVRVHIPGYGWQQVEAADIPAPEAAAAPAVPFVAPETAMPVCSAPVQTPAEAKRAAIARAKAAHPSGAMT